MTGPLHLTVAEVIEETADARSLVFDADLPYKPGQFLTLRLPDGSARCYSLASSPHGPERPKVTVKRVEGGYGSNWICDHLTAGSVVEALPPSGTFTPRSLDGDLLLLAGGSGITPVMSILKSALATGHGRITLFYANRDERSVIFAVELRELTAAQPERLTVVHWLETVQGLPTAALLASALRPYAAAEALVCGPGPFMDGAVAALEALGAPRPRVEKFVSLTGDPFAVPEALPGDDDAASVEVELDGETSTHAWPRSAVLLDALLAGGLDAPYSCREGSCGACACRVVEGEVKTPATDILDPADLADGWILSCQAVPVSPQIKITYEED